MSNKDHILEASLNLFNEQGVRAVTTNHIAAHLSISPGNLYYHFRNKEEIIRALFPRLENAVRLALVLPVAAPVTAEELGSYYLAGIETLWQYRFFFRDLDELVGRDPELGEELRGLTSWLLDQFRTLFRLLLQQGNMHPPEPETDLDRLGVNIFIIWFNWVSFLTTARAKPEVDDRDMAEGALQAFVVLAPYLEAEFGGKVRATIERVMSPRRRARMH